MCVNVGECVHVSSGALGSQRKVLRVLELHLQQVNIHPLETGSLTGLELINEARLVGH